MTIAVEWSERFGIPALRQAQGPIALRHDQGPVALRQAQGPEANKFRTHEPTANS